MRFVISFRHQYADAAALLIFRVENKFSAKAVDVVLHERQADTQSF